MPRIGNDLLRESRYYPYNRSLSVKSPFTRAEFLREFSLRMIRTHELRYGLLKNNCMDESHVNRIEVLLAWMLGRLLSGRLSPNCIQKISNSPNSSHAQNQHFQL